ncbi:hypothetical protein M758_11G029400 [Ceratodon purpureus]|uniref:Uncharacterized protein n=1 Tax=Ceratodon purpureus TaxID=3225 RepID=A0A8T0GAJ8_CERPU|nr:hypothetical protein KC19_11G031100 [Ceratodon purpureus]KAG0600384.1 hypothetical protein M758_11G029400 [Ceratodon purpureus]
MQQRAHRPSAHMLLQQHRCSMCASFCSPLVAAGRHTHVLSQPLHMTTCRLSLARSMYCHHLPFLHEARARSLAASYRLFSPVTKGQTTNNQNSYIILSPLTSLSFFALPRHTPLHSTPLNTKRKTGERCDRKRVSTHEQVLYTLVHAQLCSLSSVTSTTRSSLTTPLTLNTLSCDRRPHTPPPSTA